MIEGITTLLIVIFIIVLVTQSNKDGNASDKSDESCINTKNLQADKKSANETKKNGLIKKLLLFVWFYKETRFMIVAIVIMYFFSNLIISKIEIKMIHDFPKVDAKINHDFSGNLHTPICLQLSDRGYPITVEVRNK